MNLIICHEKQDHEMPAHLYIKYSFIQSWLLGFESRQNVLLEAEFSLIIIGIEMDFQKYIWKDEPIKNSPLLCRKWSEAEFSSAINVMTQERRRPDQRGVRFYQISLKNIIFLYLK